MVGLGIVVAEYSPDRFDFRRPVYFKHSFQNSEHPSIDFPLNFWFDQELNLDT